MKVKEWKAIGSPRDSDDRLREWEVERKYRETALAAAIEDYRRDAPSSDESHHVTITARCVWGCHDYRHVRVDADPGP